MHKNYYLTKPNFYKKIILFIYLMVPIMGLTTFLSARAQAQTKGNLESKLDTIELNGPTSWETIGDMYSQPNVHMQVGRNKLDWYGSGDVNND